MALKYMEMFVALALNLVQCASSEHILSCSLSALEPCKGEHQVCNGTTLQCDCAEGFARAGDDCEAPPDAEPYHRSATVPIVTVFALVLLVSGCILVVKKYKLVDYVRQKINQRRNNDVMYEDVMIGNDDPPLSP